MANFAACGHAETDIYIAFVVLPRLSRAMLRSGRGTRGWARGQNAPVCDSIEAGSLALRLKIRASALSTHAGHCRRAAKADH